MLVYYHATTITSLVVMDEIVLDMLNLAIRALVVALLQEIIV